MLGLTLAGYQGWFATPNDDDSNGWIHWGPLKDGTGIQEDFWPDMKEFTAPERHVAPGYTNKDGTPAELFSSDNNATVLRHFQWMEAYGIDGVAVQRFGVEVGAMRHKRILGYIKSAAAQTGRVFYVEYDLSGMHEADIVSTLTKDWAMLVQEGITNSPRYLHQGGLPVVGIFGFYMNRFSAKTASDILDVFQKCAYVQKKVDAARCKDFGPGQDFCSKWCNTPGKWGCGTATDGNYTCDCQGCNGCPATSPTPAPGPSPAPAPPTPGPLPGGQAFVAGAGQWFWWRDNPTPEWKAVFYRMNSWSPWNMGSQSVSQSVSQSHSSVTIQIQTRPLKLTCACLLLS
jgi:hypothetical protein